MIIVALGANLASVAGSPAQTLTAALIALSHNAVHPILVSKFFRSPAWPNSADPSFVNAVAAIRTKHSPAALLKILQVVEKQFGRTRAARNTPRTLDLDIIDYDGRIEAGPPELPHPRLAQRAFVLLPLAQVVPTWRDPVTGRALAELIADLPAGDRTATVEIEHPV